MATRPKQGEEQTENKEQISTRNLNRLESLVNVAAQAAMAKSGGKQRRR